MGRDPEDLALVYLFPTILIAMYFGSSVAVMSSFALTGRPAVFGPLWKILLQNLVAVVRVLAEDEKRCTQDRFLRSLERPAPLKSDWPMRTMLRGAITQR